MGKGHKKVRKRSEKSLHRKKMKSNKYKSSKWKLDKYPGIFKEVPYFPYIVERNDERYK